MSVPGSEEVRQLAATKRRARFGALLGLTLVALLALMWIMLAFNTRSFWTYGNISNLLRQGTVVAILAIGETFVIITAGIDLSVGAVTGFSTVIIALLLANNVPVWASILITLVVGLVIGAFHAFGITKLGLPPFIMTLATLTAIPNIGFLITNGATITITNDAFSAFSRGDFLGVPNLFWMVVVVAVPAYILLHHSRFGRYLFAVGSNREAARLSGVNTARHCLHGLHGVFPMRGFCRNLNLDTAYVRKRDPRSGLGIGSDRFLSYRRRKSVRCHRFGARPVTWFLHFDHHRQWREPDAREFVLAENHYRRLDYRDRLFRWFAPAETLGRETG